MTAKDKIKLLKEETQFNFLPFFFFFFLNEVSFSDQEKGAKKEPVLRPLLKEELGYGYGAVTLSLQQQIALWIFIVVSYSSSPPWPM